LGAFCTEGAAVAPAVALTYDRVFLSASWSEVLRRRWALYAALAAGVLAVLPLFPPDPDAFTPPRPSPVTYALTQPGVVLHYLRLATWPRPLCADYADWPAARTAAEWLP